MREDFVRLSLEEAEDLSRRALLASVTSEENAGPTARALVCAEADGQKGHGLSRVPSYAGQAIAGKVNGFARPVLEKLTPSAVRIDAEMGFAYPAIDLSIEALVPMTLEAGIAVACIHRSHHFGQAGAHAERLAEQGLVALVFGNSPKGIAFWGSHRAALGTNPIAFAAPLAAEAPLVIDLAMSVAARGKIVSARSAGETIPDDWAFDQSGHPTTDPAAALEGSMAPIGGAKGAALALIVEILSAAVTASSFGFEASSLFDNQGEAPKLGQMILTLDPNRLSGGSFGERMATLVNAIEQTDGARLPGTTRLVNRSRARQEGIEIAQSLHGQIVELAAKGA